MLAYAEAGFRLVYPPADAIHASEAQAIAKQPATDVSPIMQQLAGDISRATRPPLRKDGVQRTQHETPDTRVPIRWSASSSG